MEFRNEAPVPVVAQAQENARPHVSPRVMLLAAGLLLVAVLAALFFFIKDEKESLLFSEFGYAGITPRILEGTAVKDASIAVPGALMDYAREGAHEVAIVEAEGTSQVLLLGEGGRSISVGTDRKAAVAISAAGDAVAHATYSGSQGRDVLVPFINEWRIQLTLLESNEVYELGEGFAPGFFTRDGVEYLFFTTSQGVTFFNMKDKTSYQIPLYTQNVIDSAVSVREDGSYMVMRNFLTNRYALFAIGQTNNVFTLSAAGVIGEGEGALFADVEWIGSQLYAVTPPMREGSGTLTFWRIDPGAPTEMVSIGVIRSTESLRLISQ